MLTYFVLTKSRPDVYNQVDNPWLECRNSALMMWLVTKAHASRDTDFQNALAVLYEAPSSD